MQIMKRKRLPVGLDGFEKVRSNDFFYIDKTAFITELLHNWGEVNLFVRPRRFGKSLNMSMLQAFFEIGCNPALFEGLSIMQERELCDSYMGQYPVIFITLKDVGGDDFETARYKFSEMIGTEAERFSFLLDSRHLSENEKEKYKAITALKNGRYTMDDVVLSSSLKVLSALLARHYGRKTIILIDEYDVPLDKAHQAGFYDEMTTLVRSVLGSALKTNEALQFAVLTGCLRVSKESIFTGMNNLKANTMTDSRYDEYFGFTESDVKTLLEYYHLSDHYDVVKEWYDGYQFGNVSVYCPWDVVNYCDEAADAAYAGPRNYWANSSANDIVKSFIHLADQQTRDEIERLIAGEAVTKELKQELTYCDLDNSIDNLWSVLFTTGYLTVREWISGNRYRLVIPNREIRDLFEKQVKEWFKAKTRKDSSSLEKFCSAFPRGDADTVQKLLDGYLWNSISIRDTAVRKEMKENFYHGLLLGLLQYEGNWIIRSNTESGEGYSDILIETQDKVGVVIELKYAKDSNLEKYCREALDQIERNRYKARLRDDGMDRIVKYGIAFYKKRCRVIPASGATSCRPQTAC